MALVVNDRVKETSTTTGTGTFDLGGAVSGFESFVTAIGNGNTTYYSIKTKMVSLKLALVQLQMLQPILYLEIQLFHHQTVMLQ